MNKQIIHKKINSVRLASLASAGWFSDSTLCVAAEIGT